MHGTGDLGSTKGQEVGGEGEEGGMRELPLRTRAVIYSVRAGYSEGACCRPMTLAIEGHRLFAEGSLERTRTGVAASLGCNGDHEGCWSNRRVPRSSSRAQSSGGYAVPAPRQEKPKC